LTVLDSFLLPK